MAADARGSRHALSIAAHHQPTRTHLGVELVRVRGRGEYPLGRPRGVEAPGRALVDVKGAVPVLVKRPGASDAEVQGVRCTALWCERYSLRGRAFAQVEGASLYQCLSKDLGTRGLYDLGTRGLYDGACVRAIVCMRERCCVGGPGPWQVHKRAGQRRSCERASLTSCRLGSGGHSAGCAGCLREEVVGVRSTAVSEACEAQGVQQRSRG